MLIAITRLSNRGVITVSMIKWFAAGLLALYVSACTWVDVTEEGEKVRVMSLAEVTACKRVGKTTVRTTAGLAGLDRYEDKVQAELNTLARNSAVDVGGDTVVPIGSPDEGRQVFEIYRCMP